MLPFLKERHEAAASGPVEKISIEEGDGDFGMIDAIVEDLLEGVHKKDKKLVKGALEALIEHIKSEDEIQDEETK